MKKALFFVLALGMLGLSAPASALITWNFGSGCNTSGQTFGNSCSWTAGGVTVTATAWSTTQSTTNTNLEDAYLGSYTGGIGVTNRDGAVATSSCGTDKDCGEGTPTTSVAPEHAMDNNGRTDAILFTFSTAVSISQLQVGYPSSGQTTCNGVSCDSDLTLLAYTGSGSASLAGANISTLTSNGWSLIGSYADVADNAANVSTPITSKQWLVNPYNGIGGCIKSANDPTATCNTGDDYAKVLALGGDKPSNKVPEPNTLLLLGIAATVGAWGKRQLGRSR